VRTRIPGGSAKLAVLYAKIRASGPANQQPKSDAGRKVTPAKNFGTPSARPRGPLGACMPLRALHAVAGRFMPLRAAACRCGPLHAVAALHALRATACRCGAACRCGPLHAVAALHATAGRCMPAAATCHCEKRASPPGDAQRQHRFEGASYSCTPRIPTTIPLISEMRPRHHTPALLGTGVPSVL